MTLRVLAPGLLATVQDRGRAAARLGVPPAGPADPLAFAAATSLAATAWAIEVIGPPFTFSCADARIVAAAGRDVSLRVGSRRVPGWTAALARAGEEVTVRGARIVYVAVSADLTLAPVLGSRATYLPARIGALPRALAAGDELTLGASTAPLARAGQRARAFDYGAEVAAIRGPHAARFPDARAFFAAEWSVDDASDRMGTRLAGPAIEPPAGELLTCGVATGAVQVPRGGAPIVLGPDRQTTGGYFVVAVVATADLGAVAQRVPGERLRFVEVDAGRAVERLRGVRAAVVPTA